MFEKSGHSYLKKIFNTVEISLILLHKVMLKFLEGILNLNGFDIKTINFGRTFNVLRIRC